MLLEVYVLEMIDSPARGILYKVYIRPIRWEATLYAVVCGKKKVTDYFIPLTKTKRNMPQR